MPINAVVFDMDGVLIDTEQVWDEVRRNLTEEAGGKWLPEAQTAMMGMSSPEWSRYMAETLHVPITPEEISSAVVERLIARYEQEVPVLPFAVETVRSLAESYVLALASSSNRPIIDAVLDTLDLARSFSATVSSEEVARGKPAPDVYLEAAKYIGVEPHRCCAVEDSTNGIRSASEAGMEVVAIPNAHYPPDLDALALAEITIPDLSHLAEAIQA